MENQLKWIKVGDYQYRSEPKGFTIYGLRQGNTIRYHANAPANRLTLAPTTLAEAKQFCEVEYNWSKLGTQHG